MMAQVTRGTATAAMAAMLVLAMAACGEATPEAAPDETEQPPAAVETAEATPSPDIETPEPTQPPEVAGDFCEHMSAGLDLWTEFGEQVFAGGDDLAGVVERTATELPARLDAARASAPADIADDVQLSAETYLSLFAALAQINTGDADAVLDAIVTFFDGLDESTIAAFDRVESYLESECDGAVAADAADGPPDPCAFVDAQAIADAAGLGVTLDGGEPASSFSIPGLAAEQCRYDGQRDGTRVTLTVETMSLSDPAAARKMYADNAEGVIDDADLGSLPDSTLLTESFGLKAIYVFDAPTPFGLQVFPGGDLDTAALVSAATEVLAQSQ